jgi:SAM-dependent methyltransferase
MNCRFCKSSELILYLDLGFSPLGNRFLTKEELQKPEIYYPLQVYFCKTCKLSQLGYVPLPNVVYNEEYAYEAGITKLRRDHHFEMAKSICEKFHIPKDSLVVDIGSNVGVLLEGFKSQGMKVIGVDASNNVAEIARKKGIETITGFFGYQIGKEILNEKHNKAKIISATNVFAHINDYPDFMRGVNELLSDDGIFVFQVHYFMDLVDKLQYDMIFHEHILFETIKPLKTFFEKIDMDLFDVERHEIDGGTIRCFVCKKNKMPISSKITQLLKEEEEKGLHSIDKLNEFAEKVKQHREELINFLNDLKKQGKRIAAVSMPAKGVALLNYCKIDTRLIDFATEKSSLKIGKYAPGSHISIVPDKKLLENKPDYAIVLAWNFEKEIIANNKEFVDLGGKFIVPIPHPRIVE